MARACAGIGKYVGGVTRDWNERRDHISLPPTGKWEEGRTSADYHWLIHEWHEIIGLLFIEVSTPDQVSQVYLSIIISNLLFKTWSISGCYSDDNDVEQYLDWPWMISF